MNPMTTAATGELAACLRSWRERIRPADVGLPSGGQRRVRGLRREELAQLAGVSMDYLTRLEQGRATRPSSSVLGSLARALRLSEIERDHLFRLAGQSPPGSGTIDTHVPASVQRLMDRLSDVPVLITTAAREIVAANPLAQSLFPEARSVPRRERTLAWRRFMNLPSSRILSAEESADDEMILVAELQAAQARFPADSHLAALISDLRGRSPRFAELWAGHQLRGGHARRKRFHHPEVGDFELDCDDLAVHGTDLHLVVFTAAPGSPSARALQLLSAIGCQQFDAQI